MTVLTAVRSARSAADSTITSQRRLVSAVVAQSVMNGATTTMLVRSASHHELQTGATAGQGIASDIDVASAPKVAPSGAAAKAAIATNRKTVVAVVNTAAPCASRSTSAAPITASSVAPTAIVTEGAT